MQCPECLSHNPAPATFCNQCGTTLSPASRGASPRRRLRDLRVTRAIAIGSLLALCGALLFHFGGRDDPSSPPSDAPPFGATREGSPGDEGETSGSSPPEPAPRTDLLTTPGARFYPGRVVVADAWHEALPGCATSVVGDGWIAIPRRVLVAAATCSFATGGGRTRVSEGMWRAGEPVGLWRLESSIGGRVAPPLAPWDESLELLALPLHGGEGRVVEVTRVTREGAFLRFDLPPDDRAPAALVQGGAQVGWIFAEEAAQGGWLWAEEIRLEPETDLDRVYRQTFVGGREEGIGAARASVSEETDAVLIRRLLVALARPARLEREETPARFRAEEARRLMLGAASALRARGEHEALARALTEEGVGIAGSADLLLYAVESWARALGPAEAVRLARRWWSELVEPDSRPDRDLARLVADIYDRWLAALLAEGRTADFAAVWEEASELLPGVSAIRLRGVEYWIELGDWTAAEELLDSEPVPTELRDRERVLRSRISQLKSQEGKIVIRFPAGSRTIRTRARLGGSVEQDFIVDTGASMTTIPWAAVRSLGISITESTPRVRVRTAGGEILAPAVTLGGITLGGWEVPDVQVLVHDLPGQEQYGLLGVNYLDHFRVNLDTARGTLLLEPR